MFEGFPYTNFHQLNLDWIIKIAKDFLDQYTNIQQTITQGLEDLDTKATELQALLDAWYEEHSQDIANQLADALQDLNTWYTTHQGYLDQYLTDSISAFNTAADAKAATTIASIPDDYTALSNSVTDIKTPFTVDMQNALLNKYPFSKGYYGYHVVPSGTNLGLVFGFPDVSALRFDMDGMLEISFSMNRAPYHAVYAITDINDTVLDSSVPPSAGAYSKTIVKANFPAGAKYIYFCTYNADLEAADITITWDNEGLSDLTFTNTDKINNTLIKRIEMNDYTVWNYVWANVGSWTYFTDNNSFVYNVSGIDTVDVTLRRPVNNYFAYISFVFEDGTIRRLVESGGEAEINRKFSLPANVKFIVVFHYKAQADNTVSVIGYTNNQNIDNYTLENNTNKLYGHWAGKDFAWFGTSIPAGGTFKYPTMVGNILDVNIYNESVGSSPAHCRQKDMVSSANPYGFIGNFSACSRCLSNNLIEMQWIIDNWNSGVFTEELPQAMTEELAASILNNSYERKLLKYFNQQQYYRVPDLIVMNHGYNDIMTYEETDYKVPFAISGSAPITGGYQYHSGDAEPSVVGGAYRIEYDVTGISSVEINTVTAKYLDIYDLFTGSTFTSSSGMTYGSGKNKTVISVGNATKLVLTVPNGVSADEISVYNYAYFTDKFTYNGAMNFLFTQIKSRCPKARIVMIGEYADETRDLVAVNQKIVANRWDIPLYDQWNMLQFSSNFIWTTYGWVDGEFVPNAFPNGHWMKEINMYLPDGVHPHTDESGEVTEYMAQNMARWIDDIYPFNYKR